MDDVQVLTIELNGKEYFLVDKVSNEKNTYYYFSNENNKQDVCILKGKMKDNEEFYVSLDDELEFDHAMNLFYLKYNKKNTD